MNTQRTDRTGVDREKKPQDAHVDFTGDANCQHLIDTMRKRLCMQADPQTRAYAEDLKIELRDVQPELSDVLVPNCVYRCGCPEMKCCGMWREFVDYYFNENIRVACVSIKVRYELYNEWFYDVHRRQE